MVQNFTQNQSRYLFLQIVSWVWAFGLFPPLQFLLGCKLEVPFHNTYPQVFHQPIESICTFPFFYTWSRVWTGCLLIATPLTWACPYACTLAACHLHILCTQEPHGHICNVDSHWYSLQGRKRDILSNLSSECNVYQRRAWWLQGLEDRVHILSNSSWEWYVMRIGATINKGYPQGYPPQIAHDLSYPWSIFATVHSSILFS